MKYLLKLSVFFLIVLSFSKIYAKTSPTYLFYLEETSSGCLWFLALPPDLKPVEVNKASSCSTNILFSKLEPSMTYVDGKVIYKLDFKNKISKNKLAELPFELDEGERFLIGENKKLWVVKYVYFSKLPTIKKSGKEYYVYGKEYPKEKYEYATLTELFEYNGKAWVSINLQENPSSDDNFEIVIGALQNKKISKDYNSFYDKLKLGYCCREDQLNVSETSLPNILKLVGSSKDAEMEEYTYKPLNTEIGLLSKIVWGDTPHYVPPTYYCENECKKNKKLQISDFQQMGIHLNADGYLLIGEESSHAKVQVFSIKDTKPLKTFSKAVFATWLRQDYLK